MQVSRADKLEGGRAYHAIGRINAACRWRGAVAPPAEADRQAAVEALVREAEEYGADAIVGLRFEVDAVRRPDIDASPLRRIAASGVAVKFDEAA